MSKQYTQEEVRNRFLDHLLGTVRYWAAVEGQTAESRLDGLAFSFLAILDGSSMDIPAFELYAAPHPSDREYRRAQDRDWWPPLEEEVSVHGDQMLHELWRGTKDKDRLPVVCLSGEETAKLVAFADEGDREGGTTGWGSKFNAVMEVAQLVRSRVKYQEKTRREL